MEQAVYSFSEKKYTDSVLAIKSDLIFTSIVTTNFQRTLESSNAGVGNLSCTADRFKTEIFSRIGCQKNTNVH